ncbi:MAG: hypothetical protein LUH20_06050 [Lachnospiraceae bacterium]|nr:hypothetical protein [Lachnospiraceae bacterium]
MSEQKPMILSVSLNEWNIDSGIHTQTDLFKYWDSDRVAQIYTRAALPNTSVCNKFFQISENAIIKSVITRKPVGRQVENSGVADDESERAMQQEKQLYSIGHKKKSWLLTIAREYVWLFGKWETKELDQFIEEVNPDVYFIPIYPVVFTGRIQRYILKKYPKPYVCYLSDDNYSYVNCHGPLSYFHRAWLRKYVKQLAKNCDEMFTITQTQAKETDLLFDTHSVVLTKGVDFSNLEYQEIVLSGPIRMVYTGNLLIGRDASLVAISKAMEKINQDGEKIVLDIYSPTELKAETMKILNSNGCHHHGSVSHTEIEAIQKAADIVVFVESLEKKNRYIARMSFSTKLTDYFKSGKCIFAIGDETIAPIEYLRENDAAVISTDYSEVEGNLRRLVEQPELLNFYGRNAFECGKRNHNEDLIKERFVSTFMKAANSNKEK